MEVGGTYGTYFYLFFILDGLDSSPGIAPSLYVVLVGNTEQIALIIRQVLLELWIQNFSVS